MPASRNALNFTDGERVAAAPNDHDFFVALLFIYFFFNDTATTEIYTANAALLVTSGVLRVA
jgi:hypothetical protein